MLWPDQASRRSIRLSGYMQAGPKVAGTRLLNVGEYSGGGFAPHPADAGDVRLLSGVKVKCLQVLPLRRLLLLGCDDGQVRVCGSLQVPQ